MLRLDLAVRNQPGLFDSFTGVELLQALKSFTVTINPESPKCHDPVHSMTFHMIVVSGSVTVGWIIQGFDIFLWRSRPD